MTDIRDIIKGWQTGELWPQRRSMTFRHALLTTVTALCRVEKKNDLKRNGIGDVSIWRSIL
jgi:hypothetical protein